MARAAKSPPSRPQPAQEAPAAPLAEPLPLLHWLLLPLIVVAGLLAYGNGLDGAFLFDDSEDITGNAAIQKLWPPWSVVLDQGQSGVAGRPVVALSYALNYAWCKLDLACWHGVNLAIHIAAALFLYGAVRRALSSPPFAARFERAAIGIAGATALVWVAHPLTSAAVMYLGQRVESLMGMFFLATMYFALRCFQQPERKRWAWLAIGACALGTGCKEVIVAAPLLVLLYDARFVAGSLLKALQTRALLHAGLFGTWLLIGLWVLLSSARSESVGFDHGTVDTLAYLKTQAWGIVRYARLALFPHPLIFDYGAQPVTQTSEWLPHGIAIVLALVAIAIGLWKRSGVAFLGAWWFLILAPTSSFLPIVTELVVEHRPYLPSIAFVLVLVLAVHALLARLQLAATLRHNVAVALTALIVGGAAFLTHHRNKDYRSEEHMWLDVTEKFPRNARAQAFYGNNLAFNGREVDAGPYFERAATLDPGESKWVANWGIWLLNQGRLDEALVQLERARELNPENGIALQNLGHAYQRKGQTEKAIEAWREALRREGSNAGDVAERLYLALSGAGRANEGLDAYRAAAAAGSRDPALHAGLARKLLLPQHRSPSEALVAAQRAVAVSGGLNPDAIEALAEAFAAHERKADAAAAFKQAALMYRSMGQGPKADALERRAAQLEPKR